MKQIKKHDHSFDITTIDKAEIRTTTTDFIKTVFSTSNLSSWDQRNFLQFTKDNNILKHNQFLESTALLQTDLQKKYDQLYAHRNRCAHNTQSYQENLPTLKTLFDINYKYDNYFVRFALLILIDKIFIRLYDEYLKVLIENLV